MIAFFRRLRRRIIGEGKTWAYLKYALGEIVLVVLGILIALQINNWNNQRLEAQRAITLYENLKAQVEDDLRNIEGMIEYNAFLNEQQEIPSIVSGPWRHDRL